MSDNPHITYLNIGDGPDGIHIYSDGNMAIVESGDAMANGVYVKISMMGSYSRFGPILPTQIPELTRLIAQATT